MGESKTRGLALLPEHHLTPSRPLRERGHRVSEGFSEETMKDKMNNKAPSGWLLLVTLTSD